MDFKPLIPPSPTRPRGINFGSATALFNVRSPHSFHISPQSNYSKALHGNFSLSTLLLIGAAIQTVLVLLPIPKTYVLSPAITLLVLRLTHTMLITYNIIPNPYLKNAVPKKSTAQVMDRSGNFAGPGKEKVAVLLLGAKSNHPLGIFAPDFSYVGSLLQKMTAELENDPNQDTGFLGQTSLHRTDDNGAIEFILVSYWRSIGDVHKYAHGPAHRDAWKWWESTLKHHDYIGFMHEVYEADKGMWEGVYINFQPTLLGKTTCLKRDGKLVGGEVKEEWVSPLLDANKGALRSSARRRGLVDDKKLVGNMFKENPYVAEF
jgi:heme-degrading monooxygenase HmoA